MEEKYESHENFLKALQNYEGKKDTIPEDLFEKLAKVLPEKPSVTQIRNYLIQIIYIESLHEYIDCITNFNILISIVKRLYPKPEIIKSSLPEECCICLEEFTYMNKLNCNHKFCLTCTLKITKNDEKCAEPLCNYKNINCPLRRSIHTFYGGKLIDDQFAYKYGQIKFKYEDGREVPVGYTDVQLLKVQYKKH